MFYTNRCSPVKPSGISSTGKVHCVRRGGTRSPSPPLTRSLSGRSRRRALALSLAVHGIAAGRHGAVVLALEIAADRVAGDHVRAAGVVLELDVAGDVVAAPGRAAGADRPRRHGGAPLDLEVAADAAAADHVDAGAERIGRTGDVLNLDVAADGRAREPQAGRPLGLDVPRHVRAGEVAPAAAGDGDAAVGPAQLLVHALHVRGVDRSEQPVVLTVRAGREVERVRRAVVRCAAAELEGPEAVDRDLAARGRLKRPGPPVGAVRLLLEGVDPPVAEVADEQVAAEGAEARGRLGEPPRRVQVAALPDP